MGYSMILNDIVCYALRYLFADDVTYMLYLNLEHATEMLKEIWCRSIDQPGNHCP